MRAGQTYGKPRPCVCDGHHMKFDYGGGSGWRSKARPPTEAAYSFLVVVLRLNPLLLLHSGLFARARLEQRRDAVCVLVTTKRGRRSHTSIIWFHSRRQLLATGTIAASYRAGYDFCGTPNLIARYW